LLKRNPMEKINIKQRENYLLLEIKKDRFNLDLKKRIKKLKSVKAFNAILFNDYFSITIFPVSSYNLEILERDIESKLSEA